MKNKIILGVGLMALTQVAVATPFYVDMGVNYNGDTALTSDKVTDTSTSLKNEMTYLYQSQSIVTDTNMDGVVSAGDTITTQGGYNISTPAFGGIGENVVTGFNPSESFGTNNDNGYGGSNWLLTFSFTGLTGVITDYTPGSVLEISYGPTGVFDLYVTEDGTTFQNFMDLDVTGAQTVSGGTLLTGKVDFTNVDMGTTSGGTDIKTIMRSASQSCAGDNSFYALTQCVPDPLEVSILADFNTNAAGVVITDLGVNGANQKVFSLTGNHDGSIVFNVPEPTTVALLGMGLLGFGLTKRNKKA